MHEPDGDSNDGATVEAADLVLADLFALVGSRHLVANPRRTESEGGGGDFDLIVEELDSNWPLRLPKGWRLAQLISYDIGGRAWILDHAGGTVAVDTLEDPTALGAQGIPTGRLLDLAAIHPRAARAAYLTAKRVRKEITDPSEWRRIGALAEGEADAYGRALGWTFGRRLAAQLAAEPPAVPPEELMRRARAVQWLRRRASPTRFVASTSASVSRWFHRAAAPTGMVVVIAGPDGTGKTTLAEILPEVCWGPFRQSMHLHWRPGVLPRAGALVGASMGDPTVPHARRPHSTLGSWASLGYYWLDFLIGGWLRLAPFRARNGLVVMERGWWDIAVDPVRYRMAVPGALVRALGRLLPRPDLVIVLETSPDVIMARKAEIGRDELVRQRSMWRTVLPDGITRFYVDASRPQNEVAAATREAVFTTLARRTSGRFGPGWLGLPTSSSPRWLLPRGPRRSAVTGLSLYQPLAGRARLGWGIAKAVAGLGLMRMLPRGEGPPEAVRERIAPFVPRGGTVSILRSNHPGRHLVLIIGPDGDPVAVAKVALEATGIAALEREADSIEAYARLLRPPLRAPRVLRRDAGILLLEAVRRSPRRYPWMLPTDVAFVLGGAFAASATDNHTGFSHGDVAPWNLLRTSDGWVLLDWESARTGAPAFYDVWHYIVRAHALLGRPARREFMTEEGAPDWLKTALRAYASGAGSSEVPWRASLVEYLRVSMQGLDPADPEQVRDLDTKIGLLDDLSARGAG